jgi:hypothetical protein
MLGPRHIIVTVQYDQQPSYGRSLEWIAPELKGARMTMTEDHTGDPQASRTWEGTLDASTFERFARAWRLPEGSSDQKKPAATATQDPGPRCYTLDGMNWEENGKSPIVYASVQVTPKASAGYEPAS